MCYGLIGFHGIFVHGRRMNSAVTSMASQFAEIFGPSAAHEALRLHCEARRIGAAKAALTLVSVAVMLCGTRSRDETSRLPS